MLCVTIDHNVSGEQCAFTLAERNPYFKYSLENAVQQLGIESFFSIKVYNPPLPVHRMSLAQQTAVVWMTVLRTASSDPCLVMVQWAVAVTTAAQATPTPPY